MFRFITSIISILWILLVGTPQPKNSLHKKRTLEDLQRTTSIWIQRNFYIIALAAIIFLVFFFVAFCFWICGVSAVESGTVYRMENLI